VYEPGTFTPMVRLSTTAKGKQRIKPHLMVQAGLANLPEAKENSDAASAPMSMLQEMLAGMPELVQKQMEQNVKHMLKEGLSPLSKSILTNMGMDPEALLANTRQGLQEAKQAELTPVTIHYFHNDHLGAPLALTDQQANIVWAVKRDPWGNIEEEYNPQGIEQPIGLPGQRLDKETGLYYNRYRYYDPKIGSYINQDPIGLRGGLNTSIYGVNNPLIFIDPIGLSGQWKDCGKGCKIMIDKNAVGNGRHLHWECGRGSSSGEMGEYGGTSHGDNCSSAPNIIKNCARRYGFEPEAPSCPNSIPAPAPAPAPDAPYSAPGKAEAPPGVDPNASGLPSATTTMEAAGAMGIAAIMVRILLAAIPELAL